MINITVIGYKDEPVEAMVYLATDTEVLCNTQCDENGEVYIPEPSKFIEGGRVLVRIRYCTMTWCYKAIEFCLVRDDGYDLEFCVRMYLD